MIIDALVNLKKYTCLFPSLQLVADYLVSHPLESLTEGRHTVSGEDAWVSVQTCQPQSRQDARLEVHRVMMDIQIPIGGVEEHGFCPLDEDTIASAAYDEQADISFVSVPACTYFRIHPGMFVIYMPGEGHAPAITDIPFRKAVFKIKNQNNI